MIIIASCFFCDLLVWFGQLDWFILQWEEVLCNGFDLTVLNPSDKRGHETYCIVAIWVKKGGLFIPDFIFSTSCHLA